ncbi:MAG: sugar ABC transporter permease [Sphaerochaetaceae bacterium]|jgi:multiple sugar transport system permease protein
MEDQMGNKALRWMFIPTFVFLATFIYYPLCKGVVVAFQNYNMFDLTNVHFIGFKNFADVISDKNTSFWKVFLNTIEWTFFSLLLQFLLGFVLALTLRKPFRGRGIYTGLVFYTWALSGFAIGLIWSWLFNGQAGLVNDLLIRFHVIEKPIGFLSDPRYAMMSVIATNVWYGVPFFGIMLLAALQSVPNDLYEAAIIDGAGAARRLFSVTIPYIKPTIVSTLLLRTMWIVNFPDIIYAMTNGGPVNRTNILSTLMINKVFRQYDYGQGAAIGVIIMTLLGVYSVIYLQVAAKKDGT